MNRWAVVLAGGVGSRFWPLSTPERPKQLLPLVTGRPMLIESVDRLRSLVPLERTLILTNVPLADRVAALLPDLPSTNIISEPKTTGTAAALSWAAMEIVRRDSGAAVMISVHADWAIADAEAFRGTLEGAALLAEQHASLVTVGIVPSRTDAGFGYIQPGDAVNGAFRVRRFVEKPSVSLAREMVRDGYLWNSGIFVWRAGDYLDEVRTHCPEVAQAFPAEDGTVRIESFFSTVTPISVDHGILERSSRVLVLPGDFGWDDVGTWAALHRVRTLDPQGNALAGDVAAVEARGNVVHAEDGAVVLYGVSNLVVVSCNGVMLVTTREKAAELKSLLDELPDHLREPG